MLIFQDQTRLWTHKKRQIERERYTTNKLFLELESVTLLAVSAEGLAGGAGPAPSHIAFLTYNRDE